MDKVDKPAHAPNRETLPLSKLYVKPVSFVISN